LAPWIDMENAQTLPEAPEQPLFSARCLRVGQAGQYLAVPGTSQLAAFPDRIEIDGLAISYRYLLGLEPHAFLGAYSNVIEIVYATADGARAERCFSFRSLTPGKAKQQLDDLVFQVMAARAKLAGGAVRPGGETPPARPAIEALPQSTQGASRCRRLADVGQWSPCTPRGSRSHPAARSAPPTRERSPPCGCPAAWRASYRWARWPSGWCRCAPRTAAWGGR
jgi:hypothetical protein